MLALLLYAALTAPALTIDANTAVLLGEQPAISVDLFGLTAFEGFPGVVRDPDYRAKLAALRPGTIRVSANVKWYFGDDDPVGPPNLDAADGIFSSVLLFGNRYPTGRFLPLMRQMGARPMGSLGGVPKALAVEPTGAPRDFERWAEYCEAMVALFKRHDPDFDLVQIWNEPNASWFNDPRAKEAGGAAQLHIAMANAVGRRLKAKWPELQVGGPVLCWPPAWPANQTGQAPWYTWGQWAVPWLEQTRDTIDFYDFHVYDVPPDMFATQVEMLTNQALLSQGRRLPIWITESNYRVPEAELGDPQAIWTKRMLPYARFLLHGVLPQADKVAGNLWHDLHAKSWTLLPRGGDDPAPAYWLFWLFRDLRGQRVQALSDDPTLPVVAAMEEDAVNLVLFNDHDQPRQVSLAINLPCGYWTGPYVRGLSADGGVVRPHPVNAKLERVENRNAKGTIDLPAFGFAAVQFRMDRFGKPAKAIRTVETFGDRTLAFLKPGEPVTVTIPKPEGAVINPRLRLGLLGAEADDGLQVSFNGQPVKVTSAAWQEVAVPALAERNTVQVTATGPANPQLALGFAALAGEVLQR